MLLIFCEVLFLLVSLRIILFWVNLWQIKEYRLDRVYIHLRDTRQGKNTLFAPEVLLNIVAIITFVSIIFIDSLSKYYPIFVFCTLLIFILFLLKDMVTRRLKKPKFTMKAISIVFLSLVVLTVVMIFPLTDAFFWLICLLFLTPFLISFIVFLFAFPTEIYTDIYIQRAKSKRRTLKNLQVIAVSGSYGKSSTKEAIAHVLEKKYNVIKTEFSYNTPLVIAKTILKRVTPQTDFFIVELGAYKKGEIAALVDFVEPAISVTTAVSDQHLALYGDITDVIFSEMELINKIPKKGLILLNGNSSEMKNLFLKIKHDPVFWYKMSNGRGGKNTFIARDVIASQAGTAFTYVHGKQLVAFKSSLLGYHTVENILPAIILGFRYDLSEQDIQQAVETLKPLPKTMERIDIGKNILAIDDSFNASPESVAAAITFLKSIKKRKILVLSPLIELGKMSKQRHFEIGQKLSDIDLVFLTNKNFFQEIINGIKSKKGKTLVMKGSYQFLANKLRTILSNGDAIVFEGKEAGIVLSKLQ